MRDWSRRRFLLASSIGTLPAVTGCLGSSDDADSSTETATTATTETSTGNGTDTTSNESKETPGYKEYHWHGKLFMDIDGDLVDFTKPKYYLDNIDAKDAVYFHFHEKAHGPFEWSNEKKLVTFAEGLDLLPGIKYERKGDANVLTYEGTTYDGRKQGTSVGIYEGTEEIDPTAHQVEHDQNFWVQVDTKGGSNANSNSTDGSGTTNSGSGTGTGSRTGKLLFDVNNRRFNLQNDMYQSASTDRFGFTDDETDPFGWYNEGDPVTLETALNTLPNAKYKKDGDVHTIHYESGKTYTGTYRDDAEKTEILVRERAEAVDPTSYELQDGDIVWVYVHTSEAPDNEH